MSPRVCRPGLEPGTYIYCGRQGKRAHHSSTPHPPHWQRYRTMPGSSVFSLKNLTNLPKNFALSKLTLPEKEAPGGRGQHREARREPRAVWRHPPGQSHSWTARPVSRTNQCWGSVTFWWGSESADPHLWLMDQTLFFSDFKDVNKIYFLPYFFLITYPQAHYFQS